jgi:hypothetical protein
MVPEKTFHGVLQTTGQAPFRAAAGCFIEESSPLYFCAEHNIVTLLALLCLEVSIA